MRTPDWQSDATCGNMPALAQRVPIFRTPQHAIAPVPTLRLTAHVGLVTVGDRCATECVMSDELWKQIVGYRGYEVSNLGRVRSFWKLNARPRVLSETPIVLAPSMSKGYPRVTLVSDSGEHRNVHIHTAVLVAFVGNAPDGLEACHFDGDRSNCKLSNLRWGTRSSNRADMHRHGTSPRGTKSTTNKLSENDVRAIRIALDGGTSKASLARKYGVHESCIYRIANGLSWGWMQ